MLTHNASAGGRPRWWWYENRGTLRQRRTGRARAAERPTPLNDERSVEELRRENTAVQPLLARHAAERPKLREVEALVRIALPDNHLRVRDSFEVVGGHEIPALRCKRCVSVAANGCEAGGLGKCEHALDVGGTAVVPRQEVRPVPGTPTAFACARVHGDCRRGSGDAGDAGPGRQRKGDNADYDYREYRADKRPQ